MGGERGEEPQSIPRDYRKKLQVRHRNRERAKRASRLRKLINQAKELGKDLGHTGVGEGGGLAVTHLCGQTGHLQWGTELSTPATQHAKGQSHSSESRRQ